MIKKLALTSAILVALSGCQDSADKPSPASGNTHPASPEQTDAAQGSSPAKSAETEASSVVKSPSVSIDEIFSEANHVLFKNRAVSASLYGISEADAGYHYASELENYAPQAEEAFRRQMRELRDRLTQSSATDPQTRENQEVVEDILDYYAGMPDQANGFIDVWMGHSAFIVNQINGPMIDVPNNLLNSHKLETEADAVDYLARLNAFSNMATSIVAKLNADAARNWLPPRVLAKKALNYLDKFIEPPVTQSPLYQNFASKLDKIQHISNERKAELLKAAETAINDSVYKGFRTVRNALNAVLPRTRLESGIWAQPGGEAFYQYSVQKLGDTSLSAEQIHQLGLSEVERINKQMDTILRAQGLTLGTPGERMAALGEDPKFLYPNTDEGRQQLLADLNKYVDSISKKMPEQFASKPAYPVEIKRIPVATEDSSAGGYYTSPAMDGSVPGIYWINLKDTHTNPSFSLKTLTFHEAIPGHHWQIALNLGQADLPLLRRIAPYNAYVEGWALYSEKVAAEMGMYQDDPFGDLGRLQAELYRAVRLVVDTGLHYKKWTREQAIDYMAKTTGSPQADVVSEIERYMAWPGQALGYKLGMLKILELRQKSEQLLGVKFDIKSFHDRVLLGGAVPMKVLEEKINHWIESQKNSSRKTPAIESNNNG